MKFFKKLFIKNYQDTGDAMVRLRYGIVAGLYGILSNALLFGFKLAVGLLGGSITIVADAMNNLSDAGSSVVTLFGFRLSKRPADKEHPFGHARYEYVAGLFVAFLILAIGVTLAKSSVEKIISPEQVTVNLFTYLVLGGSIIVKFMQMLLYRDFGRAIRSDALRAAGADSRNDILTTSGVLLSSVIIDFTGVNVDAYFGLAVSLFIILSSTKLIKDTISPLLGEKPDKELVDLLKKKILSYQGVLGIHDLMVHSYGAGASFAIAHVEVDSKIDVMISHDLMDIIEREVTEQLGVKLSVHMDPIETDNEEVERLKSCVQETLKNFGYSITIHDFRVVQGVSHTNLLFDVVLPYDSYLCKADIENAVMAALPPSGTKYYLVIDVDKPFS
jgi:cation diffusion facilitator family transporter